MAIFGDNSAGTYSSPGTADRALLTLFTMTESGSINSAGAYFTSGSGAGSSAKVLIYTVSASQPSTLVASSSGSSIPSGGGLVTFTMSGSLSAQDYFLGVVYSDYQADIQTDGGLSGVNSRMANGTLSYASPPSTWPGSDVSYTDSRVNAYVDYSAASSFTPRSMLLGVG
jgi:hypothetical protein